MTNSEMLKDYIIKNGFTVEEIANRIGLTRQGFWKKMCNKTEFKQSEIEKLRTLLGLSKAKESEIFFAKNVG